MEYKKPSKHEKPLKQYEGVPREDWQAWDRKKERTKYKQQAPDYPAMRERPFVEFDVIIPDTPVEYTCVWCGKEMRSEVLLEMHEEEHFSD